MSGTVRVRVVARQGKDLAWEDAAVSGGGVWRRVNGLWIVERRREDVTSCDVAVRDVIVRLCGGG